MKIPKSLKIGAFKWTVNSDKNVANEGNCYGSTHHDGEKIFLDPRNSGQRAEQTFIHEIFHAVWQQYGLGKREDLKKFEEEIVHCLSDGTYQVLKDNNLLKK